MYTKNAHFQQIRQKATNQTLNINFSQHIYIFSLLIKVDLINHVSDMSVTVSIKFQLLLSAVAWVSSDTIIV